MRMGTRLLMFFVLFGGGFAFIHSHSSDRGLASAGDSLALEESTTTGNPRVEALGETAMESPAAGRPAGRKQRSAGRHRSGSQQPVVVAKSWALPFEFESFLAATPDPVQRELWRRYLVWHRLQSANESEPAQWARMPGDLRDALTASPATARQALEDAFQVLNETINGNAQLKTALFDLVAHVDGGPSPALAAYALRSLETPRDLRDPALVQAAAAAFIATSPTDSDSTHETLKHTQGYKNSPPGQQKKLAEPKKKD